MVERTFFPAAFFIENRKSLRESFGGGAPIVITANGLLQKTADVTYPFSQDNNFWYLTGLDLPEVVLVMDKDREYFILPERHEIQDIFHGAIDLEDIRARSGVEEIFYEDEGWKLLTKRLKKVKHVATLNPPKRYIPIYEMHTNPTKANLVKRIKSCNEDLSLIDLRQYFSALRSVKKPCEIDEITKAINTTKKLYKVLNDAFVKAESEEDIDKALRIAAIKYGTEFGYDTILASGKNALTMHYLQNSAPIDRQSQLLVDMGAMAGKYSADTSRTVFSAPTKRQKQIYDAVEAVLEFAIDHIRPSVTLVDLEQEILTYLGEKMREIGLIKTITPEQVHVYCPHLLMHHVGLDLHEPIDHKSTLSSGMVLAIEPGIYIAEEEIGVRLEEMVMITEGGCEVITSEIPRKIDRFV